MKIRKFISTAEQESFEEVEFTLAKSKSKPVFVSLKNKINAEFTCMLDSGASMLVWCSGAELLQRTFPGAMREVDMKSILSGFGNGIEVADIYYLPRMEVYDGSRSIIFQKVYLPIVNRDNFGANLVLPSSIFKSANILISQMQPLHEKKLFFQCRHLIYELKYTVRSLPPEVVQLLRERYGVERISERHQIVGAENEFRQELMQLNDLVK